MRTTKKQHLATAAVLAALLALTACGTEGGGAGPGDGAGTVRPDLPVTGAHWIVGSVTVDGRKTASPTPSAHVEFGEKDAKGNFGCNHFTAEADIEGDTVTVGTTTMTEMACDGPVQNFEDALRETFSGRLTGAVKDGVLTLTAADGDTITLSEQPPAPLVGTVWSIDSLLSGETAMSLPAGTEGRAYLTIGDDGSARGNLGCNTFTSTVKTKGDTMTLGRLATTRKMCEGPGMELERSLLKTLNAGTVTYDLDHRQLTVTAPDGSGFAAHAALK
ncbi:META domain-containing protein [Streptomyces sp. NPDC047928]|uniref:META domain-containing protein n=1 Tax=unclassified Streptomyces TaxID=2593676 RepID=UPI0037107556